MMNIGNPAEKVITPQSQIMETASRVLKETAESGLPISGWNTDAFVGIEHDSLQHPDWRMFVPAVLRDNWKAISPFMRATIFLTASQSVAVLDRCESVVIESSGLKKHADEVSDIVMDAVRGVAASIIDGAAHVSTAIQQLSAEEVLAMLPEEELEKI